MAFPVTQLGVVVELALGADLTAAPSTWAWTDVTAFVFVREGITITRGRADGARETTASTCQFTVDNRDGRWCAYNPAGAWFGQISRGTPVRVRTTEGSSSVRWTGFITALPPRWDISENDRSVEVFAAGILQRLERGQTPLRSALVRTISGTTTPPVAYWPGEDGSGAETIAEFFGGKPMAWTGTTFTLASDAPAGSSPVPEFTDFAGVSAVVPRRTTTDEWSVVFLMNFPASPSGSTVLLRWFTTGTYPQWQLTIDPSTSPDTFHINALDANGATIVDNSVNFQINTLVEPYGHWLLVVATAVQNGADVDYAAGIFHATAGAGITGTATTATAGRVTGLLEPVSAKTNGMLAGHWAVWNTDLDPFGSFAIDAAAFDGYDGEDANTRLARLGNEEAIDVEIDTQSPVEMGPQTTATFMDLLREIEAATSGRLFDNRDPTDFDSLLRMKWHTDFENQAAALVLDHDQRHLSPPFDPTDDDQHLRNDVTASRSGGTSARVIADSGSLTPDLVGAYEDSVTVNVPDSGLLQQAGWRVNLGTVEGLRFPQVTLDFARNPGLISSWITCEIGNRITIANPPEGIPPDTIDVLIEGWTEILGPKTWAVTLHCSPYRPWGAFELASTSGDTDEFVGRLIPELMELWIGRDTDDTTFTVGTEPRFTVDSDDYPLDLRISGERVTATAAAHVTPTFIAAGTAAHADNASVTPGMPAGVQEGDLLLVLAAIRSSGTGSVDGPAGYTTLSGGGLNFALFGKTHDGSESDPTVTFTGGSAGDTTSAQMCAFRGVQLRVLASDSILNSSAQDIITPDLKLWEIVDDLGNLVHNAMILAIAWKQDDWTSVAPPAGFTEIGEPDSVLGSDQGITWAYRFDTTAVPVSESSFVVTGGVSAISRARVHAFRTDIVDFTVTRSVNGVVKAQARGETMEIDEPGAVLAL